MRRLIFYFLVLLIAVWIGLKIAADPGYLLIAYQKVTVEMPLWLAVIGILGTFFILYFFLRLVSNIRTLGARLRAWSRQRRVRRAWQRTHRGLIAFSAGEWRLAEKDLTRAAPLTDTSIINYLAAARAAQAQGALARRDEYLAKITAKNRLAKLAVGLTQARLQCRQHQYEQALATLQSLQHIAPKHEALLRLLKQTYLHLRDWASLEILLPHLDKQSVLSPDKLQRLSIQIYQGLLANARGQTDDSMALIWQRIPKALKNQPELLASYMQYYLIKKSPDDAEELLRHVLQKSADGDLDSTLVKIYGLIPASRADRQLQTAESLLKNHGKNAALLLTLGKLCIRHQLWGKARSYLEASLGLVPSSEGYYMLAQLLEQLGEREKALEYYREGLARVNGEK